MKPDAGALLLSPADETLTAPADVQADELDIAIAVSRLEEATTLSVERVTHRWAGLRSFVEDRDPGHRLRSHRARILLGCRPGRLWHPNRSGRQSTRGDACFGLAAGRAPGCTRSLRFCLFPATADSSLMDRQFPAAGSRNIVLTEESMRAPHLSPWKEAAPLIFISGQLPFDSNGQISAEDIAGQTLQALRNLEAVLRSAALELRDVVKTTVWLRNAADFPLFNESYAEFFGGDQARAPSPS